MDITSITADLAHISIDWLILAVVFAIGAWDGYRSGSSRVASVAVALVLATSLVALIPHTALLSSMPDIPHKEAILIALAFAGLYLIVRRLTESFGPGISGPLSATLGGFGAVAVIFAAWIGAPALDSLWSFGPAIQAAFAESVRLFWILGGLTALALARG